MRVLAFRHVPFEHLGAIADALDAAGIDYEYADLFENPSAPVPVDEAGGLVFMGGPMSVNDDLAYLRREEHLIRDAVARGTPVLGICLGSQLIAKALGARVYRNAVKEIGWYAVSFTPDASADPLFAGLREPETMFHWHGETFDLPEGATWLAYSEHCRNQAFRIGANVYGLQFHPEVTPEMISCWCKEDANEGDMRELDHVIDPEAHAERMAKLATTIFGRWCLLVHQGKFAGTLASGI